MTSETYTSVTAYALSIIPLFVLMGNMASAAGYSRRLYEAAYAGSAACGVDLPRPPWSVVPRSPPSRDRRLPPR